MYILHYRLEKKYTDININFHIRTVHRDIIKVFFIHQLMHKWLS